MHCKQFIGAPLTGGRHRNHCPNCLWSRHVDHTHPGDRRSICHAAMEPIGRIVRRNGEQVLVHKCRKCGKEDPNRIAADDNPLLLMRLPLIEHPALSTAADEAAESA
ncbi:MAG: RNHCP domain-containing protein [Thermomicrobiales bacterium]|nr:RNHCP domain-containing protein [Thermomicrobiales bacterium]